MSFAVAAIALAGTALATHSWGGYHWARTSNSFTLTLGDNVSSGWDSYLITTAGDWNVSTVLDTAIAAGQTKGNCRPTTGRVEVCNKTYGNTGWLGMAQIWVSGLHITQGTVKVNDTYFNTPTYNTTGWRNLVMCQEVGHTLGLNHQDVNFNNLNLGTCMDYTNDPTGTAGTNGTLSNEHPNQHDYDELAIIYSHLDSSTTVGAQAPSSRGNHAEVNLDDPFLWGKEIRKDSRGHSSLFERDFGGGNKVFTFVIWID